MELRHLRYFVAVAEELHVTRAAERLGIAQPPLSQQIKALENELDVLLFRRVPRGVELTDAGSAFLADARTVLENVEQATAKVRRAARGQQGSIVTGFTSSAPFHLFVPDVIRTFRAKHPLVSFELEEGGTSEMAEAIRQQRMDVAFVRSPVAEVQGLAIYSLIDEPMIAAFPADHPFARTGAKRTTAAVSLTTLSTEPFVLYRRQSAPGLYDAIIGACQRAGFTPHIEQEAPRITSTLNLVAAGLGITLVPASLRQLGMEGITYRPLTRTTGLTAPINLACRLNDHSQVARNFVAFVRMSVKSRKNLKR